MSDTIILRRCMYPILFLIKGCVMIPFIFPVIVISIIFTAFFWSIPHIIMTFMALTETPRIGKNLKILSCLLLYFFIPIYFPLIFISSIFGGIFGPIYIAFKDIYVDQKFFTSCAFEYVKLSIINIWRFYEMTYPGYLDNLKKPNAEGIVFEISILKIFTGIFTRIFEKFCYFWTKTN